MRTFNDNAGRTWTLAINVDAIRRVRAHLDVDLVQAVEGKLIEKLSSDPILLCDVVFVLCMPEADQRKVNDEDFGRAMAGDAIDGATVALLEELVDFFPQSRRALLTKALDKFRHLEQKAISLVDKRLDDPSLEKRVMDHLSKRLSEPVTFGD